METAAPETTRSSPSVHGVGRGCVRVFLVVDHYPIITLTAAIPFEQARFACTAKFHLIEEGVMKVFRGVDGTARFEHQDFHAGLRQLHSSPSATSARADNNGIVSYCHLGIDLYNMMLGMSASGEAQVIGVAPVVERLNHSRTGCIERERVLAFDEAVSEVGRVLS